MKGIKYLNAGVRQAWATYQASGPKSPRIVIDLLALAQLCRDGDAWRTVQVTEADLDEVAKLVLDPSIKTQELVRAGVGVVLLLPRPVSIGEEDVEHVAALMHQPSSLWPG